MSGLAVGRIFGTEVRVHWSWVLVLALVLVLFAGDLGSGPGAWPAPVAWGVSGALALVVLASSVVHELAHVVVARRNAMGVPVVMVQLLGGPYVMQTRPRNPGQELRGALVGPALSLVLSIGLLIVYGVLAAIFGDLDHASVPAQAFEFVALMGSLFNVVLAAVNLIPGYPLDGARIVHALAWFAVKDEAAATKWAVRIGRYVGATILSVGAVILVLADPLIGLGLAIPGWLIMGSSRLLDRRSFLQGLLAGLRVSDATETDPARVPPQLTLDVFASSYVEDLMGAAALVARGSELLGLIGTNQIRKIPRRRWAETRTEQAMVPIASVPEARADEELWPALELLEGSGLDALLVPGITVPGDTTTDSSAAVSATSDAGDVAGGEAAAAPDGHDTALFPGLMSRRSAARLVRDRAEEKRRLAIATGLGRNGRR